LVTSDVLLCGVGRRGHEIILCLEWHSAPP